MSLPRRSWRISLLALAMVAALGVLAITTTSANAAPDDQAVDHAVLITLNGNQVTVDKPTVTLQRKRGDQVTWRIASDHQFAIVVERHGEAFPGSNQASESMWGNQNKQVVAVTKPTSVADTFKYTVVVYNGTRQVILDPEIVIDPN